MKPSEHIRSRQAREMRRAIRHSYRIDKSLNWMVTIDYGWQEVGNELLPSRLHSNIRKRIWAWWDYKKKKGLVSGAFCDATVWEAPNGNHHAHWLLHIPEDLHRELEQVMLDRAKKVLDNLANDDVHQQPVTHLNGAIKYLLKGTDPDYARATGIEPVYQGKVFGRRAVASMSLGRSARERDWQNGNIVNGDFAKGLLKPKEYRDLVKRAS